MRSAYLWVVIAVVVGATAVNVLLTWAAVIPLYDAWDRAVPIASSNPYMPPTAAVSYGPAINRKYALSGAAEVAILTLGAVSLLLRRRTPA